MSIENQKMSHLSTWGWSIFFLLLFLELGIITYLQPYLGPIVAPLLYLVVGIGQGVTALWMVQVETVRGIKISTLARYFFVGIMGVLGTVFFFNFFKFTMRMENC